MFTAIGLICDNGFWIPLTREAARNYADALEMFRLAPSSGNGQPWAAVHSNGNVHFFRVQKPGTPVTPAAEIRKMDVGIAMCHFDLVRLEDGIRGDWTDESANIHFAIPSGADYLCSFMSRTP